MPAAKRIAGVLLTGFLALASLPTQAASTLKIGVAISNFDDMFHQSIMAALNDWQAKHKDAALVMVDAKNDSALQLSQVETFVTQGVDAVVVMPVDGTATGPISKAVMGAKKPLVYVNLQPAELPPGAMYVGSKSIDSGILQMEELGKLMGGKGNLVILMGNLQDEPTHARTDGDKVVIKEKFPGVKVTREQVAEWNRAKGRTVMENWLASGDQIDGVAANNDEMALGAVMAIKAAGKLGKIPVCGVDATADALDSMDKGELACTVFQDPRGQGEGGVEAAYLLAKGQPNPKATKDGYVWIPFQKVTKANYKSFMKK